MATNERHDERRTDSEIPPDPPEGSTDSQVRAAVERAETTAYDDGAPVEGRHVTITAAGVGLAVGAIVELAATGLGPAAAVLAAAVVLAALRRGAGA